MCYLGVNFGGTNVFSDIPQWHKLTTRGNSGTATPVCTLKSLRCTTIGVRICQKRPIDIEIKSQISYNNSTVFSWFKFYNNLLFFSCCQARQKKKWNPPLLLTEVIHGNTSECTKAELELQHILFSVLISVHLLLSSHWYFCFFLFFLSSDCESMSSLAALTFTGCSKFWQWKGPRNL